MSSEICDQRREDGKEGGKKRHKQIRKGKDRKEVRKKLLDGDVRDLTHVTGEDKRTHSVRPGVTGHSRSLDHVDEWG